MALGLLPQAAAFRLSLASMVLQGFPGPVRGKDHTLGRNIKPLDQRRTNPEYTGMVGNRYSMFQSIGNSRLRKGPC